MTRLSVIDEIFLRGHRGLGTPIAMQGIWRTAEPVSPALLHGLHARLRTSELGRRVVRSRVPGARPRWQATTRAHPLDYRSDPLPADEIGTWAWSVVPDLDPESGPAWQLAATPVDGGGTAIAVTASHVLADARGMVRAVATALTDSAPEPSIPTDSDWSDAYRLWRTVLTGSARALRRGRPPTPAPIPRRTAPTDPVPRTAILDVPAGSWTAAAETRRISGNSLFVTATARMLWASGFAADTAEVALPVDRRPAGDTGIANRLRMAGATLRRGDPPSAVHDACRTAYDRPDSTPGDFPAELLQVLPDRLAHRLSAGAGELDLLCSDIGWLPTELTTFGPHPGTAVATRAIHPRLTAERFPRTRLSAYLCRGPETRTLALVSLDPDRVTSDAALADLALGQLRALGVEATSW